MDNYTQIVATVPNNNIILKASRTKDAYGLRLRFIKKEIPKNISKTKTATHQSTTTTLPTKKSEDLTQSYYIVVFILIAGIITLLVLKRKIAQNPPKQQKQEGWLFKNSSAPPPLQEEKINQRDVQLRFQKRINEKNSVVMLDFLNQSYLLLLGEHNNILLLR